MTSDHRPSISECPIAVVGLGGVFPDASNVSEFWSNVVNNHVAIRDVPRHRWDPELFWSPDRSEPDKSYSKIGGFLRDEDLVFDAKRFRIPPKTLRSIDTVQQLAVRAVVEALCDAGLRALSQSDSGREFDRDRAAVILGNAMGGTYEKQTVARSYFPQFERALHLSQAFRDLPEAVKRALLAEAEEGYKSVFPPITEDTMPGELSNCVAGRVANALDLRGANFTTDAACAASLAAVHTAVDGLRVGRFDLAVAGGADQMVDPSAYIKFSKIGALSAEHSVPFDARANGFVMGEGVGVLVLKRLSDAKADGDRIYAVIRGIGAASDGRGKGMTAPNPRGQRLALQNAYADAGVSIDRVGLFEAHGTSTAVGDTTELRVVTEMLKALGSQPRAVPLGSVKSMIGHLKAAAGAASLIKTVFAIHHRILPPSAGFESPPPDSPLHDGYLAVNTQARSWESSEPRLAGVSAFGFGGTNFHVVLEEANAEPTRVSSSSSSAGSSASNGRASTPLGNRTMTQTSEDFLHPVIAIFAEATGYEIDDLEPDYDLEADLGIDTVKQAEILSDLRERFELGNDEEFRLSDVPTLRAVAAYVASRTTSSAAIGAGGVSSPREDEADPDFDGWEVLGFGGVDGQAAAAEAQRSLAASGWPIPSSVLDRRERLADEQFRVAFATNSIEDARKKADSLEKRSERLLNAQGIFQSSGESLASQGSVAFLFPGQGSQFLGMYRDLAERFAVVRRTFEEADQVLEPLIGGRLTRYTWADVADEQERKAAELALRQTEICQPAMLTADVAMFRLLGTFGLTPSMVAGHSLGEYAACVAASVMSFADALYAVSARGREMAEIKVADNGKMASVAAGADRVEPMLQNVAGYVIAANKNCHAQTVIAGESASVEAAVELFSKAGIDAREIPVSHAFHSAIVAPASGPLKDALRSLDIKKAEIPILSNVHAGFYPESKEAIVELLGRQLESPVEFIKQIEGMYERGARVFIECGPRRAVTGFVRNVLGQERRYQAVATNHHKRPAIEPLMSALALMASEGVSIDFAARRRDPLNSQTRGQSSSNGRFLDEPPAHGHSNLDPAAAPRWVKKVDTRKIVFSGVALIPPSAEAIDAMDGRHFDRMLAGENFIFPVGDRMRREMVDKNVVRLEKATGEFSRLQELSDVVQLAARTGEVDLVEHYGLDANFDDALDRVTRLTIAAGIDALRDAGLPVMMHRRKTSTGKTLPDRYGLPEALSNSTGVIVGSAFTSLERVIEDVSQHVASRYAGQSRGRIEELLDSITSVLRDDDEKRAVRRSAEPLLDSLRQESELYSFSRKFLFRVLAMAHAQLAHCIIARGPNAHVNAACASGTLGLSVAQDWLRLGRCSRVLVVGADDVTSDTNLPYIGAGFLAAGAATTEADVTQAAIPFGAKRNGMILGSGAAAMVLEYEDDVAERGMEPVAELVATHSANSAFHGSRLNTKHIADEVRGFVDEILEQEGLGRAELARQMFFMSHETYTPARGGSSQAEVDALQAAFGDAVSDVIIANTKGQTGHPMGANLEDAVALKALQRGVLPAVANLNDIDPAFADLRFSRGGEHAARYALHLAAGFGSQLKLALFKQRATTEGRLFDANRYHSWLDGVAGTGARLELRHRTLRVAEIDGVRVDELGLPSLASPHNETNAVVHQGGDAAMRQDMPISGSSEASSDTGVVVGLHTGNQAPERDRDAVLVEIQAVFADLSGYDVDDLDPSYNLEADLGIDTVKQAEIFSVIRERYQIPQEDDFSLASVATLDAVTQYVIARRSDRLTPASPLPQGEPPPEQLGGDSTDRDTLFVEILALFSEESGYDVDDLDPDYELEADLGIDTVKQAEIMTALRTRYGIAPDEEFRLADVATLNAVVDYVLARMGKPDLGSSSVVDLAAEAPAPAVLRSNPPASSEATASPPAESGRSEEVTMPSLLVEITELFAEQSGYDACDLEPDYALEADLGIDTVKQAEIFSMLRERYGLPQDENFRLSEVQSLRAVADYVMGQLAAKAGVEANDAAGKRRAADSRGVTEARFDVRPTEPYELLPLNLEGVTQRGRHVVLAGDDGVFRQALRERLLAAGANVHAIDETRGDVDAIAALLGDLGGHCVDDVVILAPETMDRYHDVECFLSRAFRVALALGRASRGGGSTRLVFAVRSDGLFGFESRDPVGHLAGGLAGLAKTLAKEWPTARVLTLDLDRTESMATSAERLIGEASVAGPTEVAYRGGRRFSLRRRRAPWVAERGALAAKSLVVATGGARGVTFELIRELCRRSCLRVVLVGRSAPLARDEACFLGRSLEEQRRLARQLLEERGEKPTPVAIQRLINAEEARLQVQHNIAELRGLGSEVEFMAADLALEADRARLISEFRARFGDCDVLLHGSGREESKMIVDKVEQSLSSVYQPKSAALFELYDGLKPRRVALMGSIAGRFGNAGQSDYALANEVLSAFARSTPGVLAMNWTAWGDVGMAMKAGVKQVLSELGVEFLPAGIGAEIGADLIASNLNGDVVIAGSLGSLAADENIWNRPELESWFSKREHVDGEDQFELVLNPKTTPALDHHRLAGTAILPGVIGLELMVQAVYELTGQRANSLENVEFASPLKFHRDEVMTVSVWVRSDEVGRFKCGLRSVFKGPGGQLRDREHFRGEVVVSKSDGREPTRFRMLHLPRSPAIGRGDIYLRYFHGPAFQVLERPTILAEDGAVCLTENSWSPWFDGVPHHDLRSAPFAREAGFQAAGLWEMVELSRMALPSKIQRVTLSGREVTDEALTVDVRRTSSDAEGATFDIQVRDEGGELVDEMVGYRTAVLKRLNDDERFESSGGKQSAPPWFWVDIEEIRSELDRDTDGTLEHFLSPSERRRFDQLKTQKRRLEWLAGRIAAKRLVREAHFSDEGAVVSYPAITVRSNALGAPEIHIVGEKSREPRVSISHSDGMAAAMVAVQPGCVPGIDIEAIEARSEGFLRDYFTANERAQVEAAGDARDARMTAIWAVKEAMLKALGIGARIDLREVDVTLEGEHDHMGASVRCHKAAARRFSELGAGEPLIEVEQLGRRVVARISLPVDHHDRWAKVALEAPL